MKLKDVKQNPNPRLGRVRRRRRTTGSVEPGRDFAATWERVRAHQISISERAGILSDPPGPTSPLVRGLRALIRDRNIRTIVDIGCGDMGWWPHVIGDAAEGALRFYGVDISLAQTRANANRFKSRADWTFHVADARLQELPEADIVVCRHVLNHLWSVDAVAVRRNIAKRAHLVGFTHDPKLRSNQPDGVRRAYAPDAPRATTFTPLNLRRPPFMPMPVVANIDDEREQVLSFFPGRAID